MGVFLPGFLQDSGHFILIEVLELIDVPGGGYGALLQTVMRDMVHDDVVVGSDE